MYERIIHHNQVEFILEMQGQFYITKLTNALHHDNRIEKSTVIVPIDE